MYQENKSDSAYRSAQVVVPLVIQLLKPGSVVDIGCGSGAWLKAFQENGVEDILGIDISRESSALVDRQSIMLFDLNQPFQTDRHYDLAVCLEVAEHLPKESAHTLVGTLIGLTDSILFSAAIPGQGGEGHLNEQWTIYWQDLFKSEGYRLFDPFRNQIWKSREVDWWYRQNIVLVLKEGHPLTEQLQPYGLQCIHPDHYLQKVNRLDSIREGHISLRHAVSILSKAFSNRLRHRVRTD